MEGVGRGKGEVRDRYGRGKGEVRLNNIHSSNADSASMLVQITA